MMSTENSSAIIHGMELIGSLSQFRKIGPMHVVLKVTAMQWQKQRSYNNGRILSRVKMPPAAQERSLWCVSAYPVERRTLSMQPSAAG